MFALVPLSTKLGRRRRWKDGALAWLEEDCLFVTNVHGLPLPWILFPLGATCRETASLKFCYWKLPLYRYNPIDLSNLVQRMHLVFLYPWVSGRDCAGGVWVCASCEGLQCQSCNSHPCNPGTGGNRNTSSKWTAFLDVFLFPGWNIS